MTPSRFWREDMDVLIIILAGVILASAGQVFWKVGMNSIGQVEDFAPGKVASLFLNPYILTGLAMYGLSTIFWLAALSKKDLSFVYPFIALTYIFVLILSHLVLKEQIGAYRMIGTLIILIGLIIIFRT
jgi:drug/metabolite transporter (DMT)-like permease